MKKFAFVIHGQPATKKNSATMVRNRALLLPSKAYRKYESACREALLSMKAQIGNLPHFTLPVRMTCLYYLKDSAHWPDLNGLLQATQDILSDEYKTVNHKKSLSKEWLLSDDRIVSGYGQSKIAGVDALDPRVEIEIAELEVDLDTAYDPYIRKQLIEMQKQGLFNNAEEPPITEVPYG